MQSKSLLKQSLKNPLVHGTIVLTAVGLFTRVMGFLFRMFLSAVIGEEGMGIYHLALPVTGICMSVAAMSIQTALSRLIAAFSTMKQCQDVFLLRVSLILSLSLAGLFLLILYPASRWICEHILHEPRCLDLLRMLLLSLPFSCIHSCFCGYYYGTNQTRHPAFSQLTEQSARMGSIFLIWFVRTGQNQPMSLTDIAAGSVISEMAACLYLGICYGWERQKPDSQILSYGQILRQLASTALPLGTNRLCMTLLQTVESILIPIQLRTYGLDHAGSLSMFGVLTGMALPFIMFPSTLTHSASVLLTPKIASDSASGSHEQIKKATDAAISLCLWMGIFCFLFFFLAGPTLGLLFFQSALAGTYIRMLSWICPFLYLSITAAGILNGMGKMTVVFIHSLIAILLRTASVFFLVPRIGMNGYLAGLLTSQLVLCLLHLYEIRRTQKGAADFRH
ncbi:MAG: polysaccharide biosynthesis protein [Lachnospiraceae bacterium]|nr:polysaccharide biosynthesis protein [Lachnospiraceae bacterium]